LDVVSSKTAQPLDHPATWRGRPQVGAHRHRVCDPWSNMTAFPGLGDGRAATDRSPHVAAICERLQMWAGRACPASISDVDREYKRQVGFSLQTQLPCARL